MNRKRIKNYLLLGLAGALITLIGEVTQGYAEPASSQDAMLSLFETHAALPVWRLGLGSTVGAIGILLQYFGVYALYLCFKNPEDAAAKQYKLGVYNYAFVGAMVHVLMSLMLYVYKIDKSLLLDFTVWFVAPITAIFLVGYFWFSLVLFLKICKKQTLFPAWCCVLNPLLGKGVVNILAELIPASAISNAVSYSNMGITAILMFSVFLIVLGKQE